MSLVDSHCHLNFSAFDADRELVINRAVKAGVSHIVNPGIDIDTSKQVLALAGQFPVVYAAIGMHPTEASQWDQSSAQVIRELATSPKVVAIGEIGLDYYYDRVPIDIQKRVFIDQLHIAGELGLPVIIHSRNPSPSEKGCTLDILNILESWVNELDRCNSRLVKRPGVLHSYSGDLDSALKAIELGFFIGITGPVTFKNSKEFQGIVGKLPQEKLLVETDAPFLTPHPLRGSRNEPAYVRLVADKIAEIKNLEPVVFGNISSLNSERLFNWQVNH